MSSQLPLGNQCFYVESWGMSHRDFMEGQEGNCWTFLLEMKEDHSALSAAVYQNISKLFLQRLGGLLVFRDGRK